MRTAIICGALMTLTVTTASAQTHSATAMLPGCRLLATAAMGKDLSEAYDVGFCAGMITAILGLRTGSGMCVPSNVPKGLVVQVILRYVEARPQRMREEFGPLSIEALRDAWPCKK